MCNLFVGVSFSTCNTISLQILHGIIEINVIHELSNFVKGCLGYSIF